MFPLPNRYNDESQSSETEDEVKSSVASNGSDNELACGKSNQMKIVKPILLRKKPHL